MDPDLRLAPEGDVFDEYVAYVVERHRVWERRALGLPAPWTRSPILASKKFTNDFRVLDTGSQYVLRMVQDAEDPMDVVLRAFVYRFTNRPEVWSAFLEETGRWPVVEDVASGHLASFLRVYSERASLFNGAYIIAPPPAGRWANIPTVEWLCRLLPEMFLLGGDLLLDPVVADTRAGVGDRHAALIKIPKCGDFLGLQVATDIGYSDLLPGDEDEFVVAGPGSVKGLAALGVPSTRRAAPAEIRLLHGEIRSRVTLDVRGTPRPLSLMDVQNTLCEFGKYHGILSARGNRVRPFKPESAPTSAVHTDPVYPNHWS